MTTVGSEARRVLSAGDLDDPGPDGQQYYSPPPFVPVKRRARW